LLGLGIRLYVASRIGTHFAPFNMILSNIPGPDTPLRIAGAVVEHQTPLGPLSMNVGLTVICYSYNGWIEFGFVSTPEIADDIDRLADAIEPALQRLEQAAGL